ncbi:MAG: efflux RND transporter permease subunit, partial [Deltaproteobacteria bacterium]|nr:efflux RND transporter permease subunit [Deltaproteobacteria bacterium]
MAANVLMLVLMIGGLVTLASGLRQEVLPEVELELVFIEVVYPGASPAEVEQAVVLAVEEAVRGVDGVKEVRSTAMEGYALVSAELLLGTDKDRALNDVKSAVDRITSFPEDVERPTVTLPAFRQQAISLVLYGDVDEATLRSVAEDSRRDLLRDDRITYVELTGVRPLEISVEVPQAQLRKYHLTLDEIAARIRLASVELPGGGVKADAGEILLRTTERRDRGHEFGDIVLLSEPDGTRVHVRDIATVRDGFKDNDRRAFFNGKPAVMINVYRIGDETPITVVAAANEHVEKLQARLPEGLHAAPFYDAAEIYRDRLALLLRNARIGLVLVLLILGLFLEARLAFWVTLGIPISFAGSLLMFPAAGLSINMISLFGFIVTLGMVVDDAIVVGEAIYRHRSEGMDRLEASIAGVKEVARPVVFAILTTCMAFAPMLMIPGAMGKFFSVMPKLVIIVLLISLVESLFVLEVDRQARSATAARALRAAHLHSDCAESPALAILRHCHGHRDVHLHGRLRCGAHSIQLHPESGGRFGHRSPQNARITGRMTQLIESIIEEAEQAMRDPKRISRGIYGEIGATTTLEPPLEGLRGNEGSERSTLMLYLVSAEEREISTQELVERWRDAIGEIPGAESL